ncbi:MAG: hypothetical protein IJ158_13740 [Treponema sp.]|nr:hypothetical protein [Treponema sp.]
MLYDALLQKYGTNKPIFVSNIRYNGMTQNNIRQQIMNYTLRGKLKKYDTGIYFIPAESIFKSGSQLSQSEVISQKYLVSQNERCGYISGINFANAIGITSQVPASTELVTNKASKDYRETTLANEKIILRKPRTAVTESNYKALQLLDLLKDVELYSELEEKELGDKIKSYMSDNKISFSQLKPYLPLYPDKIFRNMYTVGVLNGFSA